MSGTLSICSLNQRQFHSILDDLRLLDCPAPQGTSGEFIEARRFLNIKWKLSRWAAMIIYDISVSALNQRRSDSSQVN